MPFSTGENVGPYRIIEKLGQGGMATVFKAYHPALDRYVAIKVLHSAFRDDSNFLARFEREARIVAKLDHPNIVPIYDFAEHEGQPYLVMQFIEGETLKARLRNGPLGPEEVLEVLRAVGSALAYAHGRGILHRDIKPSNVILTPGGRIYLTDFGLARMVKTGESTLSRDMMVGTPQYISPEQAKGDTKLDACTDIYSLGVVLYELLVGDVPFRADTPFAIIHDHIFTPLPLPRSVKPDIPEELERVLLRALAKDSEDRFQTVGELVAAFETALGSTPSPTAIGAAETMVASSSSAETRSVKVGREVPSQAEQRPRAKRRRWPWVILGSLAVLAIMGVVIWLGLQMVEGQQADVPPGPEDAVRILEDAQAARADGDLGYALELYEEAQEIDPELVEAYSGAVQVLLMMEEPHQAKHVLSEGLEVHPNNPDLRREGVILAALTEDWPEAERHAEWMLQEMPGDPSSYAFTALVKLVQGAPCHEVRPGLETALRLDPDHVWAHYGMALCHIEEGDPEAAQAELELVRESGRVPHSLIALAEEKMGRPGEGPGPGDDRFTQVQELVALVSEVPNEALRSRLKDLIHKTQVAWEAGEEEIAIERLHEAHAVVNDNWDAFGDPMAQELSDRLDELIRQAEDRR